MYRVMSKCWISSGSRKIKLISPLYVTTSIYGFQSLVVKFAQASAFTGKVILHGIICCVPLGLRYIDWPSYRQCFFTIPHIFCREEQQIYFSEEHHTSTNESVVMSFGVFLTTPYPLDLISLLHQLPSEATTMLSIKVLTLS